jgi:hypothetical protein
MEIKVESGTISLTTEDTAHGIGQALIELANRFGEANDSRSPDTKATLFKGIDWDIRFIGGSVQIGVQSLLGWTICQMTHAQASHALKVLGAAIAESKTEGGSTH